MAVLGSGDPGRIFISYRRQDADWPATWLFDRLADHFGADQVFKDVDSIRPGDDFVEVITDAVGSGHVLLAVMGKLSGHGDRVRALAFSPDGALLALAGDDATVVVWKLATWQRLHVLTDHTSGVRGVAFSPDGALLASGSGDRKIRLWGP